MWPPICPSARARAGSTRVAAAKCPGPHRGRDIYPFDEIEPRSRALWDRLGLFRQDLSDDSEKFYVLNMFPYPSGDLHAGHGRNYIMGDVVARMHMLRGNRVLAP